MHLSTWTIESAEERSERILYYRSELSIERLRSHIYITNYQRLRDTSQIKRRKELFSTITLYLFIVRISLSSSISLLNEWQSLSKRTQFSTLQSWASRVQRNCLWRSRSKIENRNIVCIEYRQWRAEQRRCVIIKQYRHLLRVYSSVTRWIEAIGSLLITLFQIHCFDDVKSSCSRRAIFSLRGFCPFDTHSIQYPTLSLRVNRENTLNRVPSKQLIFFNYIYHVQKTSVNFNFW